MTREEHAGPVGYAARPARSDFRGSACANHGAFRNLRFVVLVNIGPLVVKLQVQNDAGATSTMHRPTCLVAQLIRF